MKYIKFSLMALILTITALTMINPSYLFSSNTWDKSQSIMQHTSNYQLAGGTRTKPPIVTKICSMIMICDVEEEIKTT